MLYPTVWLVHTNNVINLDKNIAYSGLPGLHGLRWFSNLGKLVFNSTASWIPIPSSWKVPKTHLKAANKATCLRKTSLDRVKI